MATMEERRFGLGDVLAVGGAVVGGIVSGGNPAAIQAGASIGGAVGGSIDDGKNSGSTKTKNPYGYDNGSKIHAPGGYQSLYSANYKPYEATKSQRDAFDELLKLQRKRAGSSFTGPRKMIDGPFDNEVDPEYAIAEILGKNPAKAPSTTTSSIPAPVMISRAADILKIGGITNTAAQDNINVGNDFRGQPIYSPPQLANDTTITKGKDFTTDLGMTIGAIGGFKDFKEAQSFMRIADNSANPVLHSQLDRFKTENNPTAFINALGSGVSDQAKVTGFKLYEHWNSMSASQKALTIAGANAQSFTFSDGTTAQEKVVTPPITGVPSMTLSEGLALASRGTNVAPITRKWGQYSAIQETLFRPTNSSDIANSVESLDLIGFGLEGAAAQIDEKSMSQYNVVPAPQYGVGAATIPDGQGAPVGYVAIRTVGGRQVVAPKDNASTVVIDAPDVAGVAALNMYKTWSTSKDKPTKGTIGGSALVGGLNKMENTNPYTLGAMVALSTYGNTGIHKDVTDMGYVTQLAGVSLSRLIAGEASQKVDDAGLVYGLEGDLTSDGFSEVSKKLRVTYAEHGIPSKEVGYQLANQAYAEGRFDETQLVATQKALNVVFDASGYTLAQRLITGKKAGIEIMERRRG